jgi:hypothetical protein
MNPIFKNGRNWFSQLCPEELCVVSGYAPKYGGIKTETLNKKRRMT